MLWGRKFMLKMGDVLSLQRGKVAVRGSDNWQGHWSFERHNHQRAKGVLKS